ncbi:ABC transporter permease, partial [Mesorhizobium japonicum]|uniref:ABC transporter permease n=1 Tax=Mesorhizobium japonicum TaxID=2066070 RepID=UPI003B5C31DC
RACGAGAALVIVFATGSLEFTARYALAIGGIVIGNTMSSATIGGRRLLELADELGFWLIVECDYETHGFEHVGWRANPSDDPAWEAALVDRMARTVERDRNHPSVIMWSLGNEAGTGRNLAAMAAEARRRDPSRPIHYEGDWSSPDVDVYSRMYPHPDEVTLI